MENISLLEWFGYGASVLVAVSLMMSSILKLRWYNLVGASMFSAYGFMIGALPVGFLNLFIALTDIYYLFRIYTEKEYFKLLEIKRDSRYLDFFFSSHKAEIKKFFPDFDFDIVNKENTVGFYLLRNLVPAGVFIGEHDEDDTLFIHLDYVIPQYRDFKLGYYFFNERADFFKKQGYKKFSTLSTTDKHDKYLRKMGFTAISKGNKIVFEKEI